MTGEPVNLSPGFEPVKPPPLVFDWSGELPPPLFLRARGTAILRSEKIETAIFLSANKSSLNAIVLFKRYEPKEVSETYAVMIIRRRTRHKNV